MGADHQAAAICYRRRGRLIEFLVVRTSSGKWTFPKGQIDPEMGSRKCAQLEALEEAGVYGLIDERPFLVYLYPKGVFWKPRSLQELKVAAYLLEVTHEADTAEKFRQPTWCSPQNAKKLLSQQREQKYKAEIDRLIDSALQAIKVAGNGNSPLRKTRLQ